ncbi:MAG TPA: sulfotransferase [Rhizomicrobium sp.]|jgi:Flp pilus assembly protein TadD|nr:sulfotransferase [Rhizomicrobium sp.]
MSADQPTKRESGATPFAVFANQTSPNASKSHVSGRPGAAGRNPQSLKAAESLVSQGQAALGSGNAVLAQLRAKQALQQTPEYMPALLLLLHALRSAEPGGPQHEDVLRRILNQDPNDLTASAELCTLLFNRGETEECEQLARSCLRLMPLNPTLQSVMGLLLSQRGRPAAGEFHFRRVVELEGEKPTVANNLAFCLKLQGKVEESEFWYRRAVELAPDDPGVWVGWSHLEEARRNIPLAWELLREAEKRAGGRGELALERAILLGREGKTGEAIAELTRSRESGQRLHANALYERGRLYDKMDRFEEAWADLLEANRLVRDVQRRRYGESQAKEMASECQRFFRRTRMKLIPRSDPDPSMPQPIFIVGYPRSGTTMVEQTLTAHPLISAGDELTFIQDLTRIIPRWLASPNPFPGCLTDLWMGDNRLAPNQFRDYYLRRSQELGIFEEGAAFFTDKMPLNEMHLGLIHILFPRAPIIHVRRHPLDILISNFSNFLTHGFNQSFDVKTIAQHYALVDGLVEHYREQLDLNYLEIRYEDLVSDQEKYVRRMLEFIGIDFDPRCLAFHQNQRYARTASYAQVTEKLYDKSIFRYRHYRKYLDQAVAILRPTLSRLGYAPD